MANMTNLLVKDDTGTPVEFTLKPVRDNPSPFWRANVSSVPIEGQVRCTASIDEVKDGWKVTVKLEVPTLETLGASGTSAGYVAPPKVAYVTTGILTIFCNKRSTAADRINTLKMLVGLAAGASSTTGTGTLSQASAGGDWVANAAPMPQLFNGLILPN